MAFVSTTFHLLLSFMLFFFFFASSFSADGRKELRDADVDQEAITRSVSARHDRVNPSHAVQLSWRPRVFLYKGFLSDEECDHLISTAVHSEENQLRNDDKRLLSVIGTSLNSDDYIVKRIEERISTWSLLPQDYSKPLRVLKYGRENTNQKYQYFGNQSTLDVDQPLMATVILYLSNVNQGGKITFPRAESPWNNVWSECTVNIDDLGPVKGNAIIFFTVHPNATPDESSYHERCPVLNGEMWSAIKFLHIRATKREKILLDTDNTDCSDEDENCSQWAANGECQRNPTYMIGSPDYYGTCRKSCNAC